MLFKVPLLSVLLSTIILLGVTGCDNRFRVEEALSLYVADLDRSQYLSIELPSVILPIGFPSSRYRKQELIIFDIGLLDFLSLQRCAIGAVAGQKNSILGKVMLDSQRFLYEIDIIRAIESCDIEDKNLRSEMLSVAEKKRQELPKAFANAVFNGNESAAFFSLSNGYIPMDYSIQKDQSLLDSLNRLVNIRLSLEELPYVQSQVFENDLKTLSDSEYAGKLLYSLSQITHYLDIISKKINTLDESVCGAPFVYLKQQFETHYIKIIQPYMAKLNTSAYQVLPLINQLTALTPLSKKVTIFLKQFSLSSNESIWREYQSASQRHAKSWSRVITLCGS